SAELYARLARLEAALAAVLVRRFVGSAPALATVRDFVRFLLIGPLLAAGTAALGGAAVYKLGNPALDYLHYWRVFWLGDALGLLVLGSLLLAWRRRPLGLGRFGKGALIELALLLATLLAVCGWTFFSASDLPRVYLLFPLLIWAALRFSVLGASGAILLSVGAAIGSAVHGFGPFAAMTDIDNVVALQGLVAAVAVTTLMLAFVSDEARLAREGLEVELDRQRATEEKLRQASRALQRSNAELDKTVEARTEQLRNALERNQLLLREVHHRVKNNLQLISGLLSTQARRAPDPASSKGFKNVRDQVRAIAIAYDLITQMENVDEVDLSQVVPALCEGIRKAAGPQVDLRVEAPDACPVPAESAIALALAINELVTNAIKHAGAIAAPRIVVTCLRDGDRVRIRVADNGPGFPPGFDLEQDGGFGTRMVTAVVAQSGGRARVVPSDSGAAVEISVPLASAPLLPDPPEAHGC
ncbi:MAG: histidine kinase dimerization/phosphoacceptor domain -containing protein, partial [Tistlia sp.]